MNIWICCINCCSTNFLFKTLTMHRVSVNNKIIRVGAAASIAYMVAHSSHIVKTFYFEFFILVLCNIICDTVGNVSA